ncbi:hepatocellular carcinoma-associated antigen 59-domain-containing protein [Parachaetomium inaequale]|uniref:Hepatocellular carcinoma-associated antigen 59-domain-containing protein n=1 Tax=Parachaetomium inaequale TaxID=2588326 RepID=A0AAN6STZ3_9PEZI|nr:hepatocellular carcinoma-associated antigen 59-domain-containing protein [Parachaetomium inaequale]
MATINAETDAVPQVVFRPGKKRKIYRQRLEEPDSTASNGGTPTEADSAAPSSTPTTTAERDDDDEQGLSVAEVLRLRNSRKHKHGGVGFRAGPSGVGDDDRAAAATEQNTERGLVLHGNADAQQGAEAAVIGGISKRFAPQTGMVGELVNRHMEEYVESELARRKRHAAEVAAQQQQLEQQMREDSTLSATGDDDGQPGPSSAVPGGGQADSQRVLHGRLLEIDLGDEARARNIEMTERARRRLQGQIDEEEHEETKGRPRKVRLGRDGKPMRSRNRRGSDDIKRDQLVEKFLSENRLDMYDTQPEQTVNPAALEEEDGAADDRIAEEFRREFMDAMAQRNRRRRTAQPAKPGAKNQEEILKGPKLGGSRNARAAMRDMLLKEQVSKQRR